MRRAAVTLKLCDHWVNGSMVAAPTSSLPAPAGGLRNWDYRYAWIRDAAFAVFALRRIGFASEADAFLGWVLDAFEQSRRPRIMYTLGGGPVPDELIDPELDGYRRSAPVRWGNGAADQRQHDVYGEVLDCAAQWVRAGGKLEPALWQELAGLADAGGGEGPRLGGLGVEEVGALEVAVALVVAGGHGAGVERRGQRGRLQGVAEHQRAIGDLDAAAHLGDGGVARREARLGVAEVQVPGAGREPGGQCGGGGRGHVGSNG